MGLFCLAYVAVGDFGLVWNSVASFVRLIQLWFNWKTELEMQLSKFDRRKKNGEAGGLYFPSGAHWKSEISIIVKRSQEFEEVY